MELRDRHLARSSSDLHNAWGAGRIFAAPPLHAQTTDKETQHI